MDDDVHIGYTDADLATLAEIVRDVESAHATIAAAEVQKRRALARAGDLAHRQARRSRQQVREREMALRAIAAELAVPLQTTDRSAQRQIDDASNLVEHYPRTLEAWEENRIGRGHVRLIADLGAALPPEARAAFEAAALPACQRQTPARLRSALPLVAERLHPRTFTERHRAARAGRNIRVVDLRDGISELIVTAPTILAHAVYDRLTEQGRALIDARKQARTRVRAAAQAAPPGAPPADAAEPDRPGRTAHDDVLASDERTLDEVRADLAADMLLTADVAADPTRDGDRPGVLGAIRARVQVVVPVLTLLGADDGPADLVGRSPVDAETARALAATTRHPLERILTHPVTGSVVEVDTYQRPASLDRYLRARDRHCRFPGCHLPAVRCEVDHTHDHALGGRTRRGNLSHLCQRHHSMKQFTPWRVRQLDDGVLEWTSPLGRVIDDRPPAPVTFVPVAATRTDAADDSAPF